MSTVWHGDTENMIEYFICFASTAPKAVMEWFNSLAGKDTAYLSSFYAGEGLVMKGRVVGVIDWRLVLRADGYYVAFARVAVKPHEE